MRYLLAILLLTVSLSVFADVYRFNKDLDSQVKSSPVTIKENNTNNAVEVNFNLTALQSNRVSINDSTFNKLQIDDLKMTKREGNPSLPYYAVVVNSRPEELVVKYNPKTVYEIKNSVPLPAPKKLSRSDKYKKIWIVNQKSFQNSRSKLYQLEYLGDFRGIPLTRVLFFPVSYIGSTKTLEITPNIEYKIYRKDRAEVREFQNFQEIIDVSNISKRYLIVTYSRFEQSLQRLISWKRRLGFKVEVVYLEDIGESAESIKTYLKDRFNNIKTRFTYALLVGDESIFPTFYIKTLYSQRTPSDLNYFIMGDKGDFIPDVFYGRMVADDPTDVEIQIEKIIQHERADFDDFSGYRKGIGISSNEGENPSDMEYLKRINGHLINELGFSFINFFQNDSRSIPYNINGIIDQGVGWLTYLGHGSGYSWSSIYSYSGYRIGDIKNLKPDSVKPIIIDVSCLNGRFKRGRFGEQFMNNAKDGKPIGAVAYYGGTVKISWHPPAIMASGITKMISKKKYEHLGEALLAGQIYLMQNYSELSDIKDNLTWYHLLGDPSLNLNNHYSRKTRVFLSSY